MCGGVTAVGPLLRGGKSAVGCDLLSLWENGSKNLSFLKKCKITSKKNIQKTALAENHKK